LLLSSLFLLQEIKNKTVTTLVHSISFLIG
jgi:hypothetical protein